jgi:hypothetical protein
VPIRCHDEEANGAAGDVTQVTAGTARSVQSADQDDIGRTSTMSASLDHSRHSLFATRFEAFGVDRFCYVKHATRRGQSEYRIHGADGTYLCCYADRATADAALRQHEMEPLSVH